MVSISKNILLTLQYNCKYVYNSCKSDYIVEMSFIYRAHLKKGKQKLSGLVFSKQKRKRVMPSMRAAQSL